MKMIPRESLVKLRKESKKFVTVLSDDSDVVYKAETIEVLGKQYLVKTVTLKSVEGSAAYNTGWVLDNQSNKCMRCNVKFGPFTWRHHCRLCGLLICNKCGSKRMKLDHIPLETKKGSKVCFICYESRVSPGDDSSTGKVPGQRSKVKQGEDGWLAVDPRDSEKEKKEPVVSSADNENKHDGKTRGVDRSESTASLGSEDDDDDDDEFNAMTALVLEPLSKRTPTRIVESPSGKRLTAMMDPFGNVQLHMEQVGASTQDEEQESETADNTNNNIDQPSPTADARIPTFAEIEEKLALQPLGPQETAGNGGIPSGGMPHMDSFHSVGIHTPERKLSTDVNNGLNTNATDNTLEVDWSKFGTPETRQQILNNAMNNVIWEASDEDTSDLNTTGGKSSVHQISPFPPVRTPIREAIIEEEIKSSSPVSPSNESPSFYATKSPPTGSFYQRQSTNIVEKAVVGNLLNESFDETEEDNCSENSE